MPPNERTAKYIGPQLVASAWQPMTSGWLPSSVDSWCGRCWLSEWSPALSDQWPAVDKGPVRWGWFSNCPLPHVARVSKHPRLCPVNQRRFGQLCRIESICRVRIRSHKRLSTHQPSWNGCSTSTANRQTRWRTITCNEPRPLRPFQTDNVRSNRCVGLFDRKKTMLFTSLHVVKMIIFH